MLKGLKPIIMGSLLFGAITTTNLEAATYNPKNTILGKCDSFITMTISQFDKRYNGGQRNFDCTALDIGGENPNIFPSKVRYEGISLRGSKIDGSSAGKKLTLKNSAIIGDLTGANLSGIELYNSFIGGNLNKIQFRDSLLSGTAITSGRVPIDYADFRGAKIINKSAVGRIRSGNFRGVEYCDSTFSGDQELLEHLTRFSIFGTECTSMFMCNGLRFSLSEREESLFKMRTLRRTIEKRIEAERKVINEKAQELMKDDKEMSLGEARFTAKFDPVIKKIISANRAAGITDPKLRKINEALEKGEKRVCTNNS